MNYPPPGHVLRRIGITVDTSDPEVVRTSLPLVPALFVDGRLRLGTLATLVDFASGSLAVRSVAPDWTATFDMAIHRTGEAEPGPRAEAVTRLVRAGKNTVVSETTVLEAGRPLAYAEVTFSRLPRREDTPKPRPEELVRDLGLGEEPLDDAIGAIIGFQREGPGTISVPLTPFVRNSFGSLQGGVVAMTLEEAAMSLAGGGVSFLHLYYLAAAKVGPYVGRATTLSAAPAGGSITGRAELVDEGRGRLLAQGTFMADRAVG